MRIDREPPAPRRAHNASLVPSPALAPAVPQAAARGPVPRTPDAVRAVLERGLVERRFLFPQDGPARRVERWEAPALRGASELAEVEGHLGALEAALAPADRGELLARVLALLSHYRSEPHARQVELRIADDWAEDLGGFPMWAVEEAARRWRRTRKFKPQICEMIALCEEAAGEVVAERDRLRRALDRGRADANPLSRRAAGIARGLLARMPADAAD